MRRSRAAALRLANTAATLLVATLTIVAIGGPVSATSDPEAEPGPIASTTATEVLDDAEAALEGEPSATPEATPVESPSIALADLVSVYADLSEREKLQADLLLARPDGTGRPDGIIAWDDPSKAKRECGPNVCVHYVPSTKDAASTSWAKTNVSVLELVWDYEVTSLGYRSPAADGTRGGDGKLDVYLANVGAKGFYGYCTPEARLSDQSGRAFGYCVLDNDFAEFAGTPGQNLEVTAAHEFFHAVQYNYDVDEDRWLMEATATWMEERFADSVNDNRQYLKYGQLAKPRKPMDTFGGLTHYGNWLFFEKLSSKYGVGAIRSIWHRLDATIGAPDQYSIQAARNFLKAQGTTLPKFYAHYAAGNLSPRRAYAEGSAYKSTTFADTFRLSRIGRSIAPHRAKLKHLTSKSYRFTPASSLPGGSKLRISIDAPAVNTAPAAVAYIYAESGKLTKKFIKLNKSGSGSARVKFTPGKIRQVTLTLVNASTRFVCWENGGFSCDGFARDNASKFTFSAKAVR